MTKSYNKMSGSKQFYPPLSAGLDDWHYWTGAGDQNGESQMVRCKNWLKGGSR